MWELDYKESSASKNWCFLTVVLEKTLQSPLDCKEIQPVHPKGNQAWKFIGRTDAEAETLILWPPVVKNWLIGKKPWCWERLKAWRERDNKGCDDWMAWVTRWTWVWASSGSWWPTGKPGVLHALFTNACSPWVCKDLDMSERLNWTELHFKEWENFKENSTLFILIFRSLICLISSPYFWK